MKLRATMLAIPLAAGMALAQSTGGAGAQTTGSQADRTGQQSDKAQTPQSGSGATGMQADRTGGTGAGEPAQMKTMTYRGTLVDLSCAGGSASTGAGQTGGAASATTGASTATAGQSGTADRSAGLGGDCPATANSQNLGLKMDDGKVVRFDLVGNQRAQDALKNNKGWNKNLTANKPLKVKISGVLQGDKLIVSSIH